MVLPPTAELPAALLALVASRRLSINSRESLSVPTVSRVDPPVLDFLVDCSGMVVMWCWYVIVVG
jgi:hypothetical protein